MPHTLPLDPISSLTLGCEFFQFPLVVGYEPI